MTNKMKINDLTCSLHMPYAVAVRKDDEGNEIPVSLPPVAYQQAYPVDEYPACPDNWMHGSSKAGSYFVAVEEGKGMWLDFNECGSHTHEVAVVISVQGLNPITGQKQTELVLEQYGDKCPIHDCEFQQDRFCPECEFKWPAQNYLATTGTTRGYFWIDGFRSADGQVRQYVFTAEKMKGVAAQVIGEERVFAIGVAFFLSKEKKPVPEHTPTYIRAMYDSVACGEKTFDKPIFLSSLHTPDNWIYNTKEIVYSSSLGDTRGLTIGKTKSFLSPISSNSTKASHHANSPETICSVDKEILTGAIIEPEDRSIKENNSIEEIDVKLEIGQGGLINQTLHADPKSPDYWENEPAGFLYINYCTKSQMKQILDAGKRQEKKDGFLENLERTV